MTTTHYIHRECEKELDQTFEAGIFSLVEFALTYLLAFLRKTDGCLRFEIKFQKLNAVIKNDKQHFRVLKKYLINSELLLFHNVDYFQGYCQNNLIRA